MTGKLANFYKAEFAGEGIEITLCPNDDAYPSMIAEIPVKDAGLICAVYSVDSEKDYIEEVTKA